VVNCLTMSAKTRQTEKIKLLSNILKNASTISDFSYDDFDEILNIVDSISVRELVILRELELWETELKRNYLRMLDYSEVRHITVPNTNLGLPIYFSFWDAFFEKTSKKINCSKEDVEYLISLAEQKGLLIKETYDASIYGEGITSARETFQPIMKARLTTLYSKLIKYIGD
ncbi:MAG: hypothetical protein AAB316_25430, partial [Bacteroidota bacterium]